MNYLKKRDNVIIDAIRFGATPREFKTVLYNAGFGPPRRTLNRQQRALDKCLASREKTGRVLSRRQAKKMHAIMDRSVKTMMSCAVRIGAI